MFLRKEEIEEKSNSYEIVPFCKDCNSQNIEVQYTCKDCNSHNIQPVQYNIFSIDERAHKIKTLLKTIYIYKCDKCNKEFNNVASPDNCITYDCGEFLPYKYDSEYDSDSELIKRFSTKLDLCPECKQKIVDKLNKEINKIVTEEHIEKIIDKL